AGLGELSDRLLAGIDQVGVDLVLGREGPDAEHAVLALERDFHALRHIVRNQRRNTDAEIDVEAVPQLLRRALRDLLAGPRHYAASPTLDVGGRVVRCSIRFSY